MNLIFKHTSFVRVRYGETDQMGYCYYGNYAQFFEIGRVEALRTIGMSYKEMEASGIMLPVGEFSVKYLKPALYDDLLTIVTTIVELRGAVLCFDYELYNENKDLVATAKTTLIFVDKNTMKPRKAPDQFMNLIQAYIV
jgi:acyl-CoA thioester hydrolase